MAKAKYAVELKSGVETLSFQAGDKAVELSEEHPRWETDDAAAYEAIRNHPSVKDVGEVKTKGGGG